MNENIILAVLAAGIGSRFGGLKQVSPVGPSGETIIDYSLYDALRAGFSRVVFIIRRDIESDFREAIGRYWEKRVETDYVFQEIESLLPAWFSKPVRRIKPWGTGHAVLNCRDKVKGSFVAINADDFYGYSSFRDIAAYLRDMSLSAPSIPTYCFVGYKLRNTLSEFGTVSRGVCQIGRDGYLRKIDEMLKIEKAGEAARAYGNDGQWIPLTGEEVASMNIWGFTPAIFSDLGHGFQEFLRSNGRNLKAEYLIPVAVFDFINAGKARVKYIPTSERWFGVTYPEDLGGVRENIRKMVEAGKYPLNIRA